MIGNVNPLGPLQGPSAPPPGGRPESAPSFREVLRSARATPAAASAGGLKSAEETLRKTLEGLNELQGSADNIYGRILKGDAGPGDVDLALGKARHRIEGMLDDLRQVRGSL